MQLGVFTWFEINKSFIVKELCIQKDAKENACNGNCQLSKRLSVTKAESESNKSPSLAIDLKMLTFLVADLDSMSNSIVASSSPGYKPIINAVQAAHLQRLIKPPINS